MGFLLPLHASGRRMVADGIRRAVSESKCRLTACAHSQYRRMSCTGRGVAGTEWASGDADRGLPSLRQTLAETTREG